MESKRELSYDSKIYDKIIQKLSLKMEKVTNVNEVRFGDMFENFVDIVVRDESLVSELGQENINKLKDLNCSVVSKLLEPDTKSLIEVK